MYHTLKEMKLVIRDFKKLSKEKHTRKEVVEEIKKRYGICRQTQYRWLKDFGVEVRSYNRPMD